MLNRLHAMWPGLRWSTTPTGWVSSAGWGVVRVKGAWVEQGVHVMSYQRTDTGERLWFPVVLCEGGAGA